MLALDQLKDIVLNNVEKSGFLDNLRAQLKQNVYKIVEQQGDDLKRNAGFQWEHPQNSKIQAMQNGNLAINLMAEFMEYYKLEYSLPVFKKEMHITDKYISREQLSDSLQMKHTPDTNKPILLFLIQEFQKIMEMGMSMSYGAIEYNNNNFRKKIDHQKSESSLTSYGAEKVPESKPEHQIKNKTPESEEDEETTKMRTRLEELEKQRKIQEIADETAREDERIEKLRREEIESKFREQEEKERQIELQKEEDKRKKEEEKKKKEEERKRPKTAPIVQKKPPPTAVNKIRGGGGMGQEALLGIYGSSLITGQQPQQDEYDPYGDYMGQDPYAFDHTEINGPSQTAYGNFYGGGQQQQGGGYNKFSGSSGMVDPYAAIDFNADLTSNKKKKNKKGNDDDMDDYLEENIDEFGQSSGSNQYSRDKDKKNPLFTSSEDMYIGSQSVGQDMTVDSEAIDDYDYVEKVSRPR